LQIIITFVVGNWGLHAAHYNKADCIEELEHLQPWVLTQPCFNTRLKWQACLFMKLLLNKKFSQRAEFKNEVKN
jgi:hypothetical protein